MHPEGTMSSKSTMTPSIHTNPSRRSSPKAVPPAAPSRPKTAPNTPNVPASSPATTHDLVERPYAPVLPPLTVPYDREGVDALLRLASSNSTSSFSAANVATPNGLPNSDTQTSSEYDYSSNIPSRAIHSNEYSPDTTQDAKSTDASSTRPRRRRRSNSLGVESPREHSKPYDGHVLKEDTVMGDASQSPLTPSPWNYAQAPQQEPHLPHPLPPKSKAPSRRENKSKQHSHPQRRQLPPPHPLLLPQPRQSLVRQPQQDIIPYSRQTNRPQTPRTELQHIYPTDVDGYKVHRRAVPIELAQAAADILDHGMEKVQIGPTHQVFGLSLQAYEVRDEFMRNAHYALDGFRPPLPNFASLRGPTITMVSQYLPGADPSDARYSTVQAANPRALYVIVALTDLQFRNGLFTLLGGSHGNRNPRYTPMNQWNHVQNELHPGDALIWRGDLNYLLSPYGGGKYITLVFEWIKSAEKPMVDLTK